MITKKIKLFLDDERPEPTGWIKVNTAEMAMDLWAIISHHIGEVSLDHDLGEEKTGYDVLSWFEQLHHECPKGFPLPENGIKVHSANPVGRQRMQQVIDQLYGKVY